MVEIHVYVMLIALHYLFGVLGLTRESGLFVAKTVALLIGLGEDIDTVLVAEVVEAGVRRIVTGADCIDVELLHNLDVLQHALHAYHVAAIGVNLVTVGALEENGLAIDQHLRVLDFYLAEAHLLGEDLCHLVAALDCGHEGEEVRSLGSPLLDIAQREADGAVGVALEVGSALGHGDAVGVEQLEVDDRASGHVDLHLEGAVLVVIDEVGGNSEVVDMHSGVAGVKVALAGHTAEAPEVLVFGVRTVTPAECLE